MLKNPKNMFRFGNLSLHRKFLFFIKKIKIYTFKKSQQKKPFKKNPKNVKKRENLKKCEKIPKM